MINKSPLSQSHHWSHSSETAEPITVTSTTQQTERRFTRKSYCCPDGAERHKHEGPRICSQRQMVGFFSTMMTEFHEIKMIKIFLV